MGGQWAERGGQGDDEEVARQPIADVEEDDEPGAWGMRVGWLAWEVDERDLAAKGRWAAEAHRQERAALAAANPDQARSSTRSSSVWDT